MKDERLYKVILAPVVSEKSNNAADKIGQIALKVAPDATKPEIKSAVEKMFEVEVESVKVLHVRGKMKYGRHPGKRANWKKAYVRLKDGHDINFMGTQ